MKTKTPKLYYKDGNRYRPYVEPQQEDNKLYIKKNGKYVPWAMELRADALSEGVWVITRHRTHQGVMSGRFLKDVFQVDKCSGLQSLNLAQLGSMHKYVQDAYELELDPTLAGWDAFAKRVGYVIDHLVLDGIKVNK